MCFDRKLAKKGIIEKEGLYSGEVDKLTKCENFAATDLYDARACVYMSVLNRTVFKSARGNMTTSHATLFHRIIALPNHWWGCSSQ